jgi:hypothetical protein
MFLFQFSRPAFLLGQFVLVTTFACVSLVSGLFISSLVSMSSLSGFARGGAVGAGTRSTSASPPGSPHEARSSLLPAVLASGTLGSSGLPGEETAVLGLPMMTAGGARGDSMATPRQLDGYMHGTEIDRESVNASDWHDTMESQDGQILSSCKPVMRTENRCNLLTRRIQVFRFSNYELCY